MQDEVPVDAWKVPAAQFVHAEEEATEYEPTSHNEHAVDDDKEYEPEAQIPVIVDRPMVAQ